MTREAAQKEAEGARYVSAAAQAAPEVWAAVVWAAPEAWAAAAWAAPEDYPIAMLVGEPIPGMKDLVPSGFLL